MKKRALVIGTGGLRGTYDAGVAFTLCRELGSNYFDAIYAASAGTYTAAYFALNQPDSAEDIWRNYLDGSKLVNFLNPLHGRSILNLEYLGRLLQSKEHFLCVENLPFISTRLVYCLTERKTGKAAYIQPAHDDRATLMSASSAMPLIHSSVAIDGVDYIDGALSDPLPFAKARTDGYEEVVVIYNGPRGVPVGDAYDALSSILAFCLHPATGRSLKQRVARFRAIDDQLECDSDLHIIRPKVQLPLKSILDTNKVRLNACVDMGIADAKEFLRTYNPA